MIDALIQRLLATTAVTTAFAVGGWAMALISQVSDTGLQPVTVIPSVALTATAGALGYVVRLIARGDLVHRDPALASEQLVTALNHSTTAIQESTEAIRAAGAREDKLLAFLLGGGRVPPPFNG